MALFKKSQSAKSIVKKGIKLVQRSPNIAIQRELSQGQLMLTELFGGSNQLWGSGNNLPKLNKALRSGYGLINTEDTGQTGAMFGI